MRAGATHAPNERRLNNRYATHDLVCALGRVADISRTGARVVCDGAPPIKQGQVVSIRLVAGGKKLTLSAEVIRVRRPRLMGKVRSIGLKFVGLTQKHEQALENLGKFGTFMPGSDAGSVSSSESDVRAPGADASAHDSPSESFAPALSIELPDLYAILDAPMTASHDELHAAFRKLVSILHPDVNPDPEAHERFQEVVSAWQILGDPDLRARFDLRRHTAA